METKDDRAGGVRTRGLLLPKQSVGAEFARIGPKFARFEIARCVPARVMCVPEHHFGW